MLPCRVAPLCWNLRHAFASLTDLERRLAGGGRLLIACGFDGTLCPIAATPDKALPSPEMADLLRAIATSENVTMAVISGRALEDIAPRLPEKFVVAGNHGLQIRAPGFHFEHREALLLRATLEEACQSIRELLPAWPDAWVEDKGYSATLHYRQVPTSEHSRLCSAVNGCLGWFQNGLAVHQAKMAVEIRPRVNWDKGWALNFIRANCASAGATVAIGDDTADEPMFLANAGQVNIRVGDALFTHATYSLADTAEVVIYLSTLATCLDQVTRLPAGVRTGAA